MVTGARGAFSCMTESVETTTFGMSIHTCCLIYITDSLIYNKVMDLKDRMQVEMAARMLQEMGVVEV